MSRELRGLGDDELRQQDLRSRVGDGGAPVLGVVQLVLDRDRERVALLLERGQGVVDGDELGVAGGGGFDGVGRGGQGVRAELADAGVELLVNLPQLGHLRVAQRPVGVGQDLGDDPAVLDVVGVQAEQVQLGRLDVGFVGPRALQVQVDDLGLAAIGAGRVGAVGRA
jgi:hypothetical protein